MQDMFKERMNAVLPVEQLELGASILSLFEDVGFTSPFEPLQEIMEVSTSLISTEMYVSRVLTFFNDSMDDLLKAFGVEVTESCPLQYRLDLATTLIKLPNYYLPAEVLAITTTSFDNEVILAELVMLTQGVIVEESLEHLYSVSDGLIPKLTEEMQKMSAYDEALNQPLELIDLDRKRIININRLLRDPRAKDHLECIGELIGAGAKMGADFEPLVQQYVEKLTLQPADHMTIELLGLALFSNLEPEHWIDTVQHAAGEFTDLLSDHRKIEIVLNDYRVFFEM